MWSDAHAHLGSPQLQSQVQSWIQDCRRQGVDILLQGGVDPSDWKAQRKLTASYPEIRCCYGWHPCRLQDATSSHIASGSGPRSGLIPKSTLDLDE
ncbi:MAG: TatD family hydrolase, partial [Bdellovibrio sp.]